MADNEKKPKNTAAIRMIISVAIIIVLMLGMFGIVKKEITIPISAGALLAESLWSMVDAFRNKNKTQIRFSIVISAVLLLLLAGYIIIRLNNK